MSFTIFSLLPLACVDYTLGPTGYDTPTESGDSAPTALSPGELNREKALADCLGITTNVCPIDSEAGGLDGDCYSDVATTSDELATRLHADGYDDPAIPLTVFAHLAQFDDPSRTEHALIRYFAGDHRAWLGDFIAENPSPWDVNGDIIAFPESSLGCRSADDAGAGYLFAENSEFVADDAMTVEAVDSSFAKSWPAAWVNGIYYVPEDGYELATTATETERATNDIFAITRSLLQIDNEDELIYSAVIYYPAE